MAIDIAVFTDLDTVAADAAGALDRSRQPSLFDRLDWYRLLARHCPLPGTPLILRARNADGSAWLFLLQQGRKATAMANWYSLETGPISSGLEQPALIKALACHLRANLRFSAIDLIPLRQERLTATLAPFRDAGWIAHTHDATVNWTLSLRDADWNTYFNDRPSRLHNTLQRKLKLNQLHVEITDRFSKSNWENYERVYAASWKPAEGSPDFLRALAQQESEAGTLRLGLAFDEEEPVAAQLWLVEDGTATIHKLAHVDARRDASPGTILTAAMFRHSIEQEKVTQIDFGTGDDAYKSDWMDQREPLYRLSLFNPATVLGLLGTVRESLSAARAVIRRT